MESTYTNSTYFYSGENRQNVNIIDQNVSKSKNLIPQIFTAGIGYGRDARWFASAQVDYTKGRTINFLEILSNIKMAIKCLPVDGLSRTQTISEVISLV
jgi:hypothetical protein